MNAHQPDVERLVEIAQDLADQQGRPFYVVLAPCPRLGHDDTIPYCVAVEDAAPWDHMNHRCRIEPRSKT